MVAQKENHQTKSEALKSYLDPLHGEKWLDTEPVTIASSTLSEDWVVVENIGQTYMSSKVTGRKMSTFAKKGSNANMNRRRRVAAPNPNAALASPKPEENTEIAEEDQPI